MQTPITPSSQEPLSFEKIWFLFQETDKKFQETHKEFQETKQFLKEKSLESDKRLQETERVLKEKSLESDKRLQETERILKEKSLETEKIFQETKHTMQETSKEIDRLSRMYGGVSKNMGDAAEDYFYNGLSSTMQIGDIKYDIIYRNLRKKVEGKEGEFDDVLINSNSVVVMEVKYKLHLNQIEKLIQEQIPKFKKMFPEYNRYKIYGGVAGFAIPPESLTLALQNGLFVLTQKGEDMTLLNGKGFKPKAW